MATYFVGDIQGCFDEFQALLAKVSFNPSVDQLYAVGDLIARGDKSLETLRYFKKHDDSVFTVLGNHELNFFAVQAGMKRASPKDKLQPLLDASELAVLVDFLRQQPLLRELPAQSILMTHAGVPPQWDEALLRQEAEFVAEQLQRPDYLSALIGQMYGDKLADWQPQRQGIERAIYTINALTRMRFLDQQGALDFGCTLPASDPLAFEQGLQPWFMLPSKLAAETQLVFGHWAALMGDCPPPHLHALDTGCVWGEWLTLWHLESNELILQPSFRKVES